MPQLTCPTHGYRVSSFACKLKLRDGNPECQGCEVYAPAPAPVKQVIARSARRTKAYKTMFSGEESEYYNPESNLVSRCVMCLTPKNPSVTRLCPTCLRIVTENMQIKMYGCEKANYLLR